MKTFFFISTSILIHFFTFHCSLGFANQENTRLFQEANSFFHQANELKNQHDARKLYEKALLRYEKINKDISNGRLSYNIGNIYSSLGDTGKAILHYRRAEQLIPADENLKQNLTLVLEKRRDAIPEKKEKTLLHTLFSLHYDLSFQARLILFSIANISFWVAAGLMFFSRFPLPAWLTSFLLSLTLLPATSLCIDHFQHKTPKGVIIGEEVMARQGDGRSYQPSFTAPLHAGTEFILLEKRPNWYHVQLHDKRQCRLPVQSSELI